MQKNCAPQKKVLHRKAVVPQKKGLPRMVVVVGTGTADVRSELAAQIVPGSGVG